MEIIKQINLHMDRMNVSAKVSAVQNDGNTRKIVAKLRSGDKPWKVPAGVEVYVTYITPSKKRGIFDKLADGSPAVEVNSSMVTLTLPRQMLAEPGSLEVSMPDVTQLKSDIRNKLTSPSGAQVGQTFRVQAVNEDGTYTLEPVAMQPERTYIKLIELTLEEDVNVIEFESQGCDEVFIFGNCKKATTKSNVYVNAIFNGTLRDIICCVNLLTLNEQI